jgi:sirohydrochlorin ferrochelatase
VTGIGGSERHVVLAAHGSRDPRAADTVRAIRRAVARANPGVRVYDAYLDFTVPRLDQTLAALDGAPILVVPLLLTSAYHARVDIPSVVDAVRSRGGEVALAGVLTDPAEDGAGAIVAALRRRLHAHRPGSRPDGLVLAAAGTRDPEALSTVDAVAAALGAAEGVPCVAGFAAGAGRTVGEAVAKLRADGSRAVAVSSFFLAPGQLRDRALAQARAESRPGAPVRTDALCLGDAPEVVRIISRHIDHCPGWREAFA